MTRIAHLSDLHLIELEHERRGRAGRMRLRYLSYGRELAAEARVARFRAALARYRRSTARHLIVTGDLTEDGTAEQFELLASVLAQSGIDPDAVTLMPGNHDVYAHPQAFELALQGPLAPYATASRLGSVSWVDGLAIVPLSSAIPQHFARSAGRITRDQLAEVERAAVEVRGSRRTLVMAQHHPPKRHRGRLLQWFDGLQNAHEVEALLQTHTHLHVLHGHWHRATSLPFLEGPARVFGASACVEAEDPLRFYDAVDGQLHPVATQPELAEPVVSPPALETQP